MKIIDIINRLKESADERDFSKTCDTCKSGDMDRDIKKVAVTMFATPDIIRRAKEWGAQLMLVHEPLYYNHMDNKSDEKI